MSKETYHPNNMLGLILTLLGIIAIVVCAIQVYRTAADVGRVPVLWTLLTVGVGLFFQFILPFIIGLFIAIFMLITGTSLENLEVRAFGLLFVLEIVCLILSIVGMLFVMGRAGRIPDDPPMTGPDQPSPPQFQ
jgi:hypothetical protein